MELSRDNWKDLHTKIKKGDWKMLRELMGALKNDLHKQIYESLVGSSSKEIEDRFFEEAEKVLHSEFKFGEMRNTKFKSMVQKALRDREDCDIKDDDSVILDKRPLTDEEKIRVAMLYAVDKLLISCYAESDLPLFSDSQMILSLGRVHEEMIEAFKLIREKTMEEHLEYSKRVLSEKTLALIPNKELKKGKDIIEMSREDFYDLSEITILKTCCNCSEVDYKKCRLRKGYIKMDFPVYNDKPDNCCEYFIN